MIPVLLKIIVYLCGAAIVLTALSRLYLMSYYERTAPTSPQPADGHIFPLRIHNTTVYLTDSESYWLDRRSKWLVLSPVILGIVFTLVQIIIS